MASANTAERLIPVNLEGPARLLEETMIRCGPLLAHADGAPGGALSAKEERNPYDKLLERIVRLADNAQIALTDQEILAFTAKDDEIRRFIEEFAESGSRLQNELLELSGSLEQERDLLSHLTHLSGIHVRLEEIFSCRYIKARLGRLPADNGKKMEFYSEHPFLFFPVSRSETYIWGVFFTTNEFSAEIDNILDALFFERVRIPEEIGGTPAQAQDRLGQRVAEDTARRSRLSEQYRRLINESQPKLLRFFNEVRLRRHLYEIRRYVSVFSERFYLTGFARRDALRQLENETARIGGVELEVLPRR